MDTFYIVLEIQNDGTPAVLSTVYTDKNQAESKMHTVLAVAAISQLAYHACLIIDSNTGIIIEGKVYDRRKTEPEVEQTEAE